VTIIIEKTASRADAYRRPVYHFPSAREAFKAFLRQAELEPGAAVMLPAYVGWSPREGSGVFDPVRELGLTPLFYRVDERLHVDAADFEAKLASGQARVAVLIHYFGYIDPSYSQLAEAARRAGVLILEDEAHAMLSDLVGGGCGRLGDAAIFSLHKMLPTTSGGMLVHNDPAWAPPPGVAQEAALNPSDYDLHAIAAVRRRNAMILTDLLAGLEAEVEPLWPELAAFEVPQTYPVLIKGVSRFELYNELNAAGFGVVSLYHTMIDLIGRDDFPASHALAGSILNLPVHQDVGEADLRALVEEMKRAVTRLRQSAA
jgi:dTDP-4-amino-4,6-dideoxygalactose transaminase